MDGHPTLHTHPLMWFIVLLMLPAGL